MPIAKSHARFDRAEFMRRLGETKRRMEAKGVEILLVNDASNLTYLTGYTSHTSYVPQFLVVDVREEEPTFYARLLDTSGVYHLSFLSEERVVGYPEDFIGNPDTDGYDYIIDQIRPALRGRKVGLELNAHAYNEARKLIALLGDDAVVDCSSLVDWVRLIKSDAEIAVMRDAGRIADAAMKRATEVVREGARETDVAAEIVATQIRGAGNARSVSLEVPFISSTPRTGAPHFNWTADRYVKGTQINIEIGGSCERYAAGVMRTFHIGPAPDRLLRVHEAEAEGLEAALAVVRPGTSCADVANAFHHVLNRHGFEKKSRCGYSIGINWVEGNVSLNPMDRTILQRNMTFHLMLGNWMEKDFGYTISETFRVTESGVETLTNSPRQLFIL